jgi:PAS domain S-box-containing protein
LIYAVARDITERKRSDEARARLAAIVESSGDAIASTDLGGILTSWNAGAEKLFGYTQQEALGQHFRMLLPADRQDQAQMTIEAMRGGSKVFNIEREGVRKDGSRVPVSLTASPIRNEQGEVIGVSSISRDITERLRWAAELQLAKDAADAANRAKGDFLANMSHEIRTPMNAILGMTELALDSQLTPEQRDYLVTVHDAATSLLALLNDILDFSKIEAGKLQLEETDFSLRDLVADSMRVLGLRAHRKGLELASDVRREVPDLVVGDPTRLRQVLVNLVGNAIKFTEHGEVVVRVARQEQSDGGVVLHFAVADTGIGIPRGKQEAIFESFVQADSSTTRKYGGTGLGLTISAQLISMMGGRIWVESEPGLGSTFHFTAGFARPAGGYAAPSPASAQELRGLRVLVVDDSATNRRIMLEMLEQWGMKPAAAVGVTEALSALHGARHAGAPFALVLTDANMPERDGFELAAEIRAHSDLDAATVMMITSGGRAGDAARCRELGLAGYLLKPVKQSDLLDAILTALAAAPRGSAMGAKLAGAARASAARRGTRPAPRALRVLIAEDHPVNQELATRILEKRGHTCRVAQNGAEALAMLGQEKFDAVLMDVQMPVMNGLEAAEEIRVREKSAGGHVPIIAMTAHAMAGDRERCLAAGMDGYLAKPIDSQQMIAVLEGSVDGSGGAAAEAAPRPAVAPNATPTLDHAELRERTGGNAALMQRLARIFLQDAPGKLREIERSIARKDADALFRAAHALRGSAATLAARATAELAHQLEVLGRSGSTTGARALFTALKGEVSQATDALSTMILAPKRSGKLRAKSARRRARVSRR